MRFLAIVATILVPTAAVAAPLQSVITPFNTEAVDQIVLKNDGFADDGGQAYLQLGFVSGEKAGIWVQVPEDIEYFKVDYFRVLLGSRSLPEQQPEEAAQVFFQMGKANDPGTTIPRDIENAAQVTPGAFWNDIPAEGLSGPMPCFQGGDYIGAALEFTWDGAPSVYRDLDGMANIQHNTLMEIRAGWNYSYVFGLRGDWILRVVGHKADPDEC